MEPPTQQGRQWIAEARRRDNLTFRARDGLKSALQDASARNGRSVSEEIEHRLELSMNDELWAARVVAAMKEFWQAVLEKSGKAEGA